MSISYLFFPLLSILLMAGLPIGLPPAEPDPVIERMAPPQALIFACSSGAAEPRSDSPNHTEQFLAEPEIRRFAQYVDELWAKLANGPDNATQNLELHTLRMLTKFVAGRPGMIYLSELRWPGGRVLTARGGAVVRLGAHKAETARLLKQLEGETKAVEIGGFAFRQLNLEGPQEETPLTFGIADDLLILAIGRGEVEALLERRSGEPPQWLTKLRKRFDVPRQATVTHIDLAGVRALLGEVAPPPQGEPLLRLGLSNMERFVSVSGLDETGYVRRSALDLNGPPDGLLGAVSGKPLSAEELAPIPADATIGLATRLDISKLVEAVVESMEPVGAEPLEEGFEAVEKVIGMKVREDFLAALGDSWTLHTSPTSGGLIAGWTLTAEVENRGKVQLGLALERVRQAAESGGRTKVGYHQYQDQDIYTVSSRALRPFTLSYCVTESHLVLAMTPQAVKTFLAAGKKAPLASVPSVAERLQRKPLLIAHTDNRRVVEEVYPWLTMLVQLMRSEIRSDEFDLDTAVLPTLDVLRRHAAHGHLTIWSTDAGMEFELRQQLPTGSGSPLLLLGAALLGIRI